MKPIERLRNFRRNLIAESNAGLERSLSREPRISERTKAQIGAGLTAGGTILFEAGRTSNNNLLI